MRVVAAMTIYGALVCRAVRALAELGPSRRQMQPFELVIVVVADHTEIERLRAGATMREQHTISWFVAGRAAKRAMRRT